MLPTESLSPVVCFSKEMGWAGGGDSQKPYAQDPSIRSPATFHSASPTQRQHDNFTEETHRFSI